VDRKAEDVVIRTISKGEVPEAILSMLGIQPGDEFLITLWSDKTISIDRLQPQPIERKVREVIIKQPKKTKTPVIETEKQYIAITRTGGQQRISKALAEKVYNQVLKLIRDGGLNYVTVNDIKIPVHKTLIARALRILYLLGKLDRIRIDKMLAYRLSSRVIVPTRDNTIEFLTEKDKEMIDRIAKSLKDEWKIRGQR